MKRVYFVQIPVSYSSPCYLPYSAGCIAAYVKSKKEITDYYEIPEIIAMRERIEDAVGRFEDPFLVAFSCFTWNIEYNKALASELKKKFPEVIILFGGHSLSVDASSLDEMPFVDLLMHGEGEEAVTELLLAYQNGTDLAAVPGISYRDTDSNKTNPVKVQCDLTDYPSPYTTGIFDELLRAYPDIEFHATLETNRGCPYSCAYCEWSFTRKIRPFPMEKIKAEIEWIAKNKIRYCNCADANFGILERDVDIARYAVEQNKIYGYPEVFKPCYAKDSDETVFQAGYLLNINKMDKGVTLAYQSLNPVTLENIGRKNLTLEHFAALDARYTEAGIPTYTEMILGLPGETFESFSKGICHLLESGQNNSMTVYECQVYSNSMMGDPEYRKKHGIKTSRIPIFGIHYDPAFNGVQEYFDIITETATMPKNDWVKSYIFSVILQTFHHLGLVRYFAIYLNNDKKVPYYEFYTSLYDYILEKNDGFLNKFFTDLFNRKADTDKADWTYARDVFGTIGWYFEEGAFLEMVCHSDIFWKEIKPFLESFDIQEDIFNELFEYQKSLIRLPEISEVTVKSSYSFYKYFEAADENLKPVLEKKSCTLHVRSPKKITTWDEYAREIIWFGKRHSATLLVNPREIITYTED